MLDPYRRPSLRLGTGVFGNGQRLLQRFFLVEQRSSREDVFDRPVAIFLNNYGSSPIKKHPNETAKDLKDRSFQDHQVEFTEVRADWNGFQQGAWKDEDEDGGSWKSSTEGSCLPDELILFLLQQTMIPKIIMDCLSTVRPRKPWNVP